MRLRGWTAHIGIALGADRLVATLPRGRTLETADVADLRQVLSELKTRTGLMRAKVDVALLPPLVDVRAVTLPPLRHDERDRVLERDARRYFLGLSEPLVVGSVALGSKILAAAAPATTVREIESAVGAAGWTLGGVVPAHAAWAVGVPDGEVAVPLARGVEVLGVMRGRLVQRRRFLANPENPSTALDPFTLAARHVSATEGPELLSPERRAERAKTARRIVRSLWTTAAACVLFAAGLDYWGLARALSRVEARRNALAPAVARVMAGRDSLTALIDGLTTLQGLSGTSPQWSSFLADLADFLPRDAHLVAVRAAGDSAMLEGVARESAGVFEALQQMPRLAGVRAGGPIQRDILPDGSITEHFAFSAWLGAPPDRSHP